MGVLRFQSTPWFQETLNGGDVYFLLNSTTSQTENLRYVLEKPFIRTQLTHETGNHRLLETSRSRQLSSNELLYKLEVILLELGYDAPLHYLRNSDDIKDGDGDTDTSWLTDCFTARKLGKSALRNLDARYGKLVKKCLDCDFGVGDDLKSAELQLAVVRDVVHELDKCIKLDGHINSILVN